MRSCVQHKKALIFLVFIVKISGMKCRALLQTSSGSSYQSETLINEIK